MYINYQKGKHMRESIEIEGASENNLKHLNVNIPKEKFVVLAGISGSGKSSLAFDTVAAESIRQWQATYPLFLRHRLPSYKRPAVENIRNLTPCVVVDQHPIGSNARSTVGTASDVAPLIRLLFSRIGVPSAGGAMAYSFNHPHGMCPSCTGLGEQVRLDEEKMFDIDKSINEGAIRFRQFFGGSWQDFYYRFNPLLDADKKLRDYTDEEWKVLRIGPDEPLVMDYIRNNTGQVSKLPYEGVVARFNRLYLNRDISGLKKEAQAEAMQFVQRAPCPVCGGSGLNPAALASKINGRNISDYYAMQVSDLLPVLEEINDPLGHAIAGQILESLRYMVQVGLGYLSLSRRTDTLSGGEAQRLKMVRHLGSSLSNITYVFDEPTAGLHPADARRIGDLLLSLRDKHNTVLVVEHTRQMIELADHIIEIGPLSGSKGGEIVYQGDLDGLKKSGTVTAESLVEGVLINENPLPWDEGYPIEHREPSQPERCFRHYPERRADCSHRCSRFRKEQSGLRRIRLPQSGSSSHRPETYRHIHPLHSRHLYRSNGRDPQAVRQRERSQCPVVQLQFQGSMPGLQGKRRNQAERGIRGSRGHRMRRMRRQPL